MLTYSRRLNAVLSVLFVAAMEACGSAGGCGACSAVQPLPGGQLPAPQTVEGGAQIRVTPHGFSTLTSVLPGLLNQQLSAGFCLPGGSVADGLIDYCQDQQGSCKQGCRIVPTLNTISVAPSASNAQALSVHVDAAAKASVPLSAVVGSCTVTVTVPHLTADVDVILGTNAATGELTIQANPITNFSFSGQSFSGCSIISDLASAIVDLLHDTVASFVSGLLSPSIGNLISGFIPSPLGLAGELDIGSALASISPSTQAMLEARIVPGGYVQMHNGGLSLGVITGINADRDPTTRTGALASEPALCVPALTPPALGAPPFGLAQTPRQTFQLGVADALNGVPSDPATDLAMGVSRTTLDLAGHHLVTSGALCLSIGTAQVSQLNLATIGLLVPSLAQLGSPQGNDPILLVTRPQRAVSFSIGDNTDASPAVSVDLEHLQVDFYAFLYERYVRAFTLDLSMNVGVNADLAQAPGGAATIQPMLVGITPANVTITVLNSEFIRESPAELEAVLPSVFSLLTPVIGNLPAITVPSFAGFSLGNPTIHHLTTAEDDFLAIYAQLTPSASMRILATSDPRMASAVATMDTTMDTVLPAVAAPSSGRVRLTAVTTPPPEVVRGALLHTAGGALPRVAFDADALDASGRPLEWSYQLERGMWRPWRAGPLVIEDEAFAWQGKYTIGLRSRVVGDYRTVSEAVQVPVIIDSVAPHIAVDKASRTSETYTLPAFDSVSGEVLQYAFGAPGAAAPASPWIAGGAVELSSDTAAMYAGAGGTLTVFVRDEAGNVAKAVVAPFGALGESGCACDSDGTPGAGTLVLAALVLGLAGRRRSSRARFARAARRGAGAAGAPVVLVALAFAAVSAGCGHSRVGNVPPDASQGLACGSNSDCTLPCPSNAQNLCVDNACVCATDVPVGRVGPYSHVAVGPDGAIWVSAYAETYGDLVVATASAAGRIGANDWQWVDGVPAGPVTFPGSKIRGGIDAAGPNVGMYTSIAVAADGTVSVSYFDSDNGSLKLAQSVGGAWQIHVVDAGTGQLGDAGAVVGMYTALTLRSDDGRPGIAYLAHVRDASGTRAEVRFASAQTPHPMSAGDWQTWVVDTAPLPSDDPTATLPLPEGLGLFVAVARMPNQAPVVAYYDRSSGDLKLARFNVQSGQFAAAQVLDGSGGSDVGWTPSVAVDASGVAHVAYASATANNLRYTTDAAGAVPQVIDNGYRIDGTTVDGLQQPVFHFVGNDAALVLPGGGAPMVAYQDATTQELLLATQQANGSWTHTSIAGATNPWPGGYGFFVAAALGGGALVMSSWVIDQPAAGAANNWVEVFVDPLTP